MSSEIAMHFHGPSSLHECQVQIRAMNGAVAHGAGLILLGLVVCRPRGPKSGRTVTLQTQQVHLRDTQETGIGRTMGCVATHASLGFHRHVLVDEGSLLVGVALVANGVASGSSAHLAQRRCAMHVVAIAAGEQTLVHTMAVGTGKVGAGRGMAAIAKFGLGLDQQLALDFGMVRAVAIEATNIVTGMS